MAATWATSSVRSSAISAKNVGFVSGPFRFRSHSQAGVSSERIHLSCYPVVLVLKQQHERENTVAFASICGP